MNTLYPLSVRIQSGDINASWSCLADPRTPSSEAGLLTWGACLAGGQSCTLMWVKSGRAARERSRPWHRR